MTEMKLDQIQTMLRATRIGRLSMADEKGRPYTIPLPYCWADGAIYLRLPMSGRKGRILLENNNVCFEIDQCSDTLDDYASVLVEGRIFPVTDVAEKQRIKQINDSKYNRLRSGHRPGHGRATPLEEVPLRKIVVEQLSGRQKDRVTTEHTESAEGKRESSTGGSPVPSAFSSF